MERRRQLQRPRRSPCIVPPGSAGGAGLLTHEHHMLDGLALLEFLAQQGQPLRRRHQDPGIAVPHDVTDLLGPQQRVDRDEDRRLLPRPRTAR